MPDHNKGPWGESHSDDTPSDPKKPPQTPWSPKPGSNGEDPKNLGREVDNILNMARSFQKKLGGNGSGSLPPGDEDSPGPRALFGLFGLGFLAFFAYQSVYQIDSSENALVLRLGKYAQTWDDGLHFAPWPVYTVETLNIKEQRVESIGVEMSESGQDLGLMLTSDENIIDIEFDVVWRIKNLQDYQFNLVEQRETIQAVAQSSIREVVARSPLIPLLSVERDNTMSEVETLIQQNLDSYNSGVEIVRVNMKKSSPPAEVIAAFEDVQAAEQERDTLQSNARAESNTVLATARGEAAQILEDAQAYQARIMNEAEGEASRFASVLDVYQKSPEIIRRRLYIEAMAEIYGDVEKVIMDGKTNGEVLPYLPLKSLKQQGVE